MAMTPREKIIVGGKLYLRCKECALTKPSDVFYFNVQCKSFSPYCDKCNCARAKKWHAKNKKYRSETQPKYIPLGTPEQELFIKMTLKELAL